MRSAKGAWERGTRVALLLGLVALACLPLLRVWQDRRAEALDGALREAVAADARAPAWTAPQLAADAAVLDGGADDACVREATRLAVAWAGRVGGARLSAWGEEPEALRVAAASLARCGTGASPESRRAAAQTLGLLAARPPPLAASLRAELLAVERALRRRYSGADEPGRGLVAEWVGGAVRRQRVLAAWDAVRAERERLEAMGGPPLGPGGHGGDATGDLAHRWHALALAHAPHLAELDDASRKVRRAEAAHARLVGLADALAGAAACPEAGAARDVAAARPEAGAARDAASQEAGAARPERPEAGAAPATSGAVSPAPPRR
jgi:hypothetical protein